MITIFESILSEKLACTQYDNYTAGTNQNVRIVTLIPEAKQKVHHNKVNPQDESLLIIVGPMQAQGYVLQPGYISLNQLLILISVLQAQQFQAVFQKRLLEHLGAPNSPKRQAYRKKTQPSLRRRSKNSSLRRKINTQNTTSRPPTVSRSPLQKMTTLESWPSTLWKAEYFQFWSKQVWTTDTDCWNMNWNKGSQWWKITNTLGGKRSCQVTAHPMAAILEVLRFGHGLWAAVTLSFGISNSVVCANQSAIVGITVTSLTYPRYPSSF